MNRSKTLFGQLRRRAALSAVALVIAVLLITGCSDVSLYDLLGGERGGNLAPGATIVNLEVNSTYPVGATGGFEPYTFSVFGNEAPARGSVDPVSGLYSAPAVLPDGEFAADTVVIADHLGTKVSMTARSFARLRSGPPTATVDVRAPLALTVNGGVPPYDADVADDTGSPDSTRGSVVVSGNQISFTAPDEPGKSLVIVSDQIGNEIVVTIHVVDPFGPLAITPPTATLEFGEDIEFAITGGNTLMNYTTTVVPEGFGSIADPLTATPKYTAPDEAGVAQITVTDGDGSTAKATVYVVAGAHDELVIAPALIELRPNTSATFTVTGGVPGYHYTLQPDRGSLAINGSTVVYTAPGSPGNIRLNVTDQSGQEASATIRVRN